MATKAPQGDADAAAARTAKRRAAAEATRRRRQLQRPSAGQILLDAGDAAAVCGVGRGLFLQLVAAGKAPLPVHLERRVLWPRVALEAWAAADCPPRGERKGGS